MNIESILTLAPRVVRTPTVDEITLDAYKKKIPKILWKAMSSYKTAFYQKNGCLRTGPIDMSQTIFNCLFSSCITSQLPFKVYGAKQENTLLVTYQDFIRIFNKRIPEKYRAQ
jgi:hypothetical protein